MSVEKKVIENWDTPEVFKTLKEKDLINEKEVVFEAFSLKGDGTSTIYTLQRVKPGIVKIKNYYLVGNQIKNDVGIKHWSNEHDIGYNPEAKADQALYDGEDKFLRGVGL